MHGRRRCTAAPGAAAELGFVRPDRRHQRREPAWVRATYRYNASIQYKFSDHVQLSLAVDNLFDKLPPRDPTYTSYPYYDISWFDAAGRSYYLQFTYKFGGSAL